jgi:hypothetical protein
VHTPIGVGSKPGTSHARCLCRLPDPLKQPTTRSRPSRPAHPPTCAVHPMTLFWVVLASLGSAGADRAASSRSLATWGMRGTMAQTETGVNNFHQIGVLSTADACQNTADKVTQQHGVHVPDRLLLRGA